ncbi:MAG: hypothetical protein K8R74_15795 [Bacteroidales bacterium]|nr:hypothetical protein [Bacteroidales bacterium]
MRNFYSIKMLAFLILPIVFLAFELNDENKDAGITPAENKTKQTILDYPAPGQGCLACHKGIEPIREHDSKMMRQIYREGEKMGDPNGCVVCHFGNASEEKNKKVAHNDMVRYPGSMWVNDKTCGKCHEDHIYNLHRNLMQTEAGKIQGAVWGWGALSGYKVKWGNYDIDDPDGPVPKWGTEKYKEYMHSLMDKNPDAFPDHLEQLPETNLNNLDDHPEEAVFTYLRGECQRCHVGVKGKQRRGDYRGMGCAACHVPFTDEGFYEGDDPTIPKDKPGHSLVHSIQSSRKAKVTVNGITYSGIPAETCTSCHNRGKRVGVSFLGMIESSYDTPWNDEGNGQPKLHGKMYQIIKDDVHHSVESRPGNPTGSLLCQDCHTTIAVHGNGNIGGATLGEIEVECADCHGTPHKYPWELPLGFQDEYGIESKNNPRGVTNDLLEVQEYYSTVYDPEDGYLLSARGNPFGNVVKRGRDVIVHSASGLDFTVPALKNLKEDNSWRNPEKAITAMCKIGVHIEKMECYACHATWAAQCYGCHVKVDYADGKKSVDWIKSGSYHYENGETAETLNETDKMYQPGVSKEGRTYIRWEDPVLGVNGEGRITPIIPGCQQITTVIGEDGEVLVLNKIWRTPGGMENSDENGQRGIDMTPAQPHTISAKARECTSCHTNPKTLGYGVEGGEFMLGYEEDTYKDLQTYDGKNLSTNARPQFPKIEDLPMDLSQVVTRDGKQVQTVGHHWPLSGPLSQYSREKMERVGVCISCHQDVPDGNIFIKATAAAGEVLGLAPHHDNEHMKLLNMEIKWAAMTRILLPVVFIVIFVMGYLILRLRKKLKNSN